MVKSGRDVKQLIKSKYMSVYVKGFSIMCDESFNSAIRENLIFALTFANSSPRENKVSR